MITIYHAGLRMPMQNRATSAILPNLCRALCPTRIAPVNSFQKITELGCGYLNRVARATDWPDELTCLEAFQIERCADPIMP